METTLIFAVVLVGVCVLLFGIRIFFVKGGKFPNGHVEGNQALLDKGIRCAQSENSQTSEHKHLTSNRDCSQHSTTNEK